MNFNITKIEELWIRKRFENNPKYDALKEHFPNIETFLGDMSRQNFRPLLREIKIMIYDALSEIRA